MPSNNALQRTVDNRGPHLAAASASWPAAQLGRYTSRKKTYRGSCHCGRIKFEVEADLDHVRICDCSMCRRRGGLLHRVAEGDLKLLTPLDQLTLYQWNTRTAKDYFCPVCGIQPFRRPRTAPEQWSVNVRCLEGVDIEAIPRKYVHGSKLSSVHDV